MTTFPGYLYQVCATYDGEAACYLDFTPSFPDALDNFIKAVWEKRTPRVLAITFDVETNMPETVSDVTEEFEAAMDREGVAA